MLPPAPHRTRRVALALLGGAVIALPPGHAGAQESPAPPTSVAPPVSTPGGAPASTPAGATASGRTWLAAVPTGCTVPNLPDVVFVGTLLDKGTPAGLPDTIVNQTARFRLDQARAGSLDRFTYNGIVDVRYGPDTKDLEKGEQYLIGASVGATSGVLSSTVREAEPSFGGDDVIAAAQQDLKCPVLVDPVRTLHTDGTPVDDSLLQPMFSSKTRLLRAILLPLMVAFGVVFVLALIRWLLTGAGKGVASVFRTASQPREVRAAVRSRPNANPDLNPTRGPERNPNLEDADRRR